MVIVLVQRAMQGHAIGLEQQVLQCVNAGQSQRTVNAIRQIRIVKHYIQAKCFGAQCNCATDASEANQAQCVATDTSATLYAATIDATIY